MRKEEKKQVNVVAAIIIKEQKIFAAQRGYGKYKGGWEFPGGKIELNETPEDAIKREIKEELDIDIHIESYLCRVKHEYEDIFLDMQCFICTTKDEPVLKEHEGSKWVSTKELSEINWLDADLKVVECIVNSTICKAILEE